ncbi:MULTISPECIES: mobile mystery protein A [Macellibacteroides]|jgi:predicted DNA-binding mobile mystery protein A|uniref:Mobile mystery protein A n=2 Tax=Bacteroidales TaxID=171549 RepID=A0A1T5AMB6_9BACT|nr:MULTISPECIES: mobile mystery protein A [Bacteroidales]NYI50837.1 putative DNA-binding mobile mystery protein A [Macellibacteroides fermentans]SKB36144.1 mobile mystery protein A [Parabacteroides chartae]
MINRANKLYLEQIDRKIKAFSGVLPDSKPMGGWIEAVRKAIGMNMRQLATKMNKTPQAIKQIQEREKAGTITLNSLEETAAAMNMRLVYAIVPMETSSLSELIQQQAEKMAKEIVIRANKTMSLEDQKISEKRIKNSIKEISAELAENPEKLWE